MDGVEQPGAVPHAPADTQPHRQAVGARQGPLRGPPPRGLEAEQPACRGGNPDGSAAIGGVGHRDHARRDRRRRPTARPARRAVEVPRVAGGAVQHRLGNGDEAELGGIGAPQADEPGSVEPFEHGGRLVGDVVAEEHRTERHPLSGFECQVLDEERDAGKGPLPGRGGFEPGLFESGSDDGIDGGIASLDPCDSRLDELTRMHVAPGDQFRQAGGIVVVVGGEGFERRHRQILGAGGGGRRSARAHHPRPDRRCRPG